MVVRRIGVQRAKLVGVVDGAELGDIEDAVGRELDAEHVVDADVRDDGLHQLGMLRQRGAHQQAAVAAPFDRQFFDGDVYPRSIRCCSTAAKSSKTFCLFVRFPCRCHGSPYSPPPRRLATAQTMPWSSRTCRTGLNDGDRLVP